MAGGLLVRIMLPLSAALGNVRELALLGRIFVDRRVAPFLTTVPLEVTVRVNRALTRLRTVLVTLTLATLQSWCTPAPMGRTFPEQPVVRVRLNRDGGPTGPYMALNCLFVVSPLLVLNVTCTRWANLLPVCVPTLLIPNIRFLCPSRVFLVSLEILGSRTLNGAFEDVVRRPTLEVIVATSGPTLAILDL